MNKFARVEGEWANEREKLRNDTINTAAAAHALHQQQESELTEAKTTLEEESKVRTFPLSTEFIVIGFYADATAN